MGTPSMADLSNPETSRCYSVDSSVSPNHARYQADLYVAGVSKSSISIFQSTTIKRHIPAHDIQACSGPNRKFWTSVL